MSTYGFEIPHTKVMPARDIVAVQLPFPPKKIGNILTPDIWRDISQHGMQAGIIRAMGPLAFQYKDGNGLAKQAAEVGDWVLIKWGAGTMFQASKGIVTAGGWRYLSSFNDVIGVIRAHDMPDPATLCWDESESALDGLTAPAAFSDDTGVRERIVYPGEGSRKV